MISPISAALVFLLVWAGTAQARLPKRDPGPVAFTRYQRAADYSEERGGLALLVVEGDAIVFQRAARSHGMGDAYPIYSGVKGLTCPLAMAAVQDDRIGLDDAAAGDATTPVRVRNLLSMTSGLDEARWQREVDGPRRGRPADRFAFARSLAVVDPPGQVFRYSGVHAAALGGWLVTRGVDPRRLLGQRVFRPLGITPRDWASDGAKNPELAHGMRLTPEHWARLGMLMRDDGVFGKKRLFAAGSLARCLEGSPAMPAYGFGWWLNKPITPAQLEQIPPQIRDDLASPRLFAPAPADLFAAIGSYGQRLYVVPSRDLVIVRVARASPKEPFKDAELLGLLEK